MKNGNQQKATLKLPSTSPSEPIKESVATAVEAAPTGMSDKDAAAAEEILAVQRLEQVKAMAAMAEQPVIEEEPQDIASIAARGRDYLMERLARHAAESRKVEEERPKPYVSPSMQAKIDAEIARGREVQARHQAQQDARPKPQPEVWDGTNTVVARPGSLVPDPKKTPTNTSVSGTFAAGHRQYSPNV